GLLGNVAAGRIANRLDLGGTNCVIDAACGSSLGALEMAAMQLWTHKSDMAITGGVDTFNDIFMFTCFCKTPALSPTGHARPFSEDNDGTILGEGIGMYVLKRLSDAERDGDRIYACINAVGSSSDGKGKAIYAPSAEGQKKALLRAYEESGISPKDIGMVEAHGTGTGAGDQVELAALNEVYGASETGRPWCALGSVKSQIGHTKAAAGSANIIKAALALYHKVIPPTIKVSRPAKILREANSPFYLPKDIRPWITENGKPRHAAVSSMGFGGSNFHVILSEYDQYKTVTEWESGTELFTFSGANSKEIKEKLSALNNAESSSLRKLAAQSRRDFNAESACRLAFMAENGTDVLKLVSEISGQLDTCADKGFSLPNGATYSQKKENAPVGILFPGQGSQYPGMLADLICSTSEGINTLIEADRETGSVDNFGNRLTDYIYPRPNYDEELDKLNNEKLRSTDIAQPAIGSISLGSFKVLESFGLKASAFAGHSFGELVALSAAGAYDGSTLAKLSRKRGRLMAMGSGDKGGMIAVLGERKTVEEILEKENIDLVVANHNSHKQVVLSGKTSEVERAKDIFKAHKLKGTILNVAGAFHSSFVADAAKPFYDFVKNEKFNNLRVPVYANTTGNKYPENVDEVKSLLGNQLANQVRFVEIIENMYNSGIRTFIEVGPGNVLSGMLKNILNTDDYKVLTLDSSGGKRSSVYDLGRLLGQLSALGYKLDIEKWQNGTDYLKTAANVKSSKFTFKLCGANYKSAKQLEVLANLDKPVTVKPTITKAAISETETNNTPVLANKEPQQTQNFGQVSMNNSIKKETKVTAVTDETIAALQAMQQQTADLHRKFLEGQELAQKTLMALLSGGNAPVLTNTRPAVSEQQRVNVYEPVKAEIKEEPKVVMQKPAERATKIETPKTELPKVELPKVASVDTDRIRKTLLDVVAEKTGYPTEMLNLEMDMEADLGIDSIKRVEIMSAMQERLPDAPVVQPDQLGKLRTLAQILEYMSANNTSSSNVAVSQKIVEEPKTKGGLNTEIVKAALLEVVAEKTGYPTEMLNLEMDMEADLGIDSIKRVEIMSAMQERLPDAPVVQPDQLGKLRTLAQIMEHLSVNDSCSETSACNKIASDFTTAGSSDYDTVLLGVVAEKTGYPVEMLSLDMDMEADLGIDSIKRVEILSGFQEKMPDAPVVQPSDLGNFRTIGQILDFLHSRDCKSACKAVNTTESAANETESGFNEGLEGSVIRTVIRTVEISPVSDGEKILRAGDTVLISNDDAALSEAVKVSFTKAGLKAETRSLAQIIEGQFPIDTKGLVIIAPAPEKALMNLWESSSEEWLKDAFMAIQKAGQAVKLNKGVIATVSRLDGRFGLDTMTKTTDPVQGGLAGIAKTIRYEWSEVAAKAIDLDYRYKDEIEVADRLVAEVSAKSFMEVGLSKNSRIKIEEIESELSEDNSCPANFRKSDVIIVTGGARGVTAETAIAFAEKYNSTMVLIGRSPLPNEEPAWLRGLSDEGAIKKAILANSGKQLSVKELQAEYHSYMANREVLNNLERIRSFGSNVFYYSADIRNESEIEKIVEKVRIEAGNITGLIHGAGVLRDRRIEDKTREQISDVLDTKVSGLRNILKAISRDNLKVIVLFSSFSGRQGRLGQVDYAMANEVLNKAAQKLRILRPECRVMAFNWGPWDGGMVNSSLRNVFLAEGIGLIPLKAGARCPITELTNPSENAVEIGIMGTLGITDGSTGSLSEATRFTKAFDYNLNVEENTWLRSHVLNGDPVLPMAVAGELMSEAALINNIGMQFIGYNEMRILKGVVLKNSTSQVISVYSSTPQKTDEGYSVICEIRSKSNDRETINARAEIILSDTFVESSPEYLNVDAELIYPDSINEVYENDLFHGEFFKSLTEILGWSDKGIKALSKTSPAPSEWFARPIRTSFCSEPMSIDAAYQLMILWTTKVCGAPSLPGYAKKYRKFINNYSDERVIISARARRKGSMMAEADIDFITESGKVAARIEGYECTLNENLKHAFKLRKVIGA
ncbi:MAG: SDR family NAD(P)-dependent oxidoreductase, partial [Candidatus Riflebacteria bacterium]